MVHKESIFPDNLTGDLGYFRHEPVECVSKLAEAKERVPSKSEYGNPVFILALNKHGEVEHLWCFADHEEVIRKRLKTWSGCYGAWPIRRLNGSVPLGR